MCIECGAENSVLEEACQECKAPFDRVLRVVRDTPASKPSLARGRSPSPQLSNPVVRSTDKAAISSSRAQLFSTGPADTKSSSSKDKISRPHHEAPKQPRWESSRPISASSAKRQLSGTSLALDPNVIRGPAINTKARADVKQVLQTAGLPVSHSALQALGSLEGKPSKKKNAIHDPRKIDSRTLLKLQEGLGHE